MFDNLTALTYLGLHTNQLTTLPDGVFDNLTALTYLGLHTNQLTTLPDGVFDNLTALTYLGLHTNQLTTLPDGVFDNLTALTYLGLHTNQLTTLPDGVFDNLTALIELRLYNNQLTTLPDGVFDNLTALIELYLHGNLLVSLEDDAFTSLTKLETLWIGENQLTSLPAGLVASPPATLHSLSVGSNPLGTLPEGFLDDLPAAMEFLGLGGRELEYPSPARGPRLTQADVDTIITHFTALRELRIAGTGLNVDQARRLLIAQRDSLERLRLGGGDDMSGLANENFSWRDLPNLTELQVYEAGLTADDVTTILESVNTDLTLLYLDGNDLSGMTDVQLANIERLTSLRRLRLVDGQLSSAQVSSVLDWILSDMEWLYLNGNELSGVEPSKFSRFTHLQRLGLGNGKLSGAQVTAILKNLPGTLTELDLSHSGLSSVNPGDFSRFQGLRLLYLHGNPLEDPVPLLDDFSNRHLKTLTVNRTPAAPVIADRLLAVGTSSFGFGAVTDPDGDGVTYAALGDGVSPPPLALHPNMRLFIRPDDSVPLPSWVTFNPATRMFTTSPQTGDDGTITVRVTATDDGFPPLSSERTFTITIDTIAPVVSYTAPRSMTVGRRIRAINPVTSDDDIISYSLQSGSLPWGLSLDESTGSITGWARSATGRRTVTIVATDAAGNTTAVSLTFPRVVADDPPPTATPTPVPTATLTPVPTATLTPVPTATLTPVPTATLTPVPTATPTPVPTATPTPVPTATPTPEVPEDDGGMNWWIIVPIILVVVPIAGGGAYVVMRQRRLG